MGRYEGQVYQIPRQRRFVKTAVCIGQELFRNYVFSLENRYTQGFADCPFKIDASFQDVFEFDGYIFDFQERAYSVAIGANVPCDVERPGKNSTERPVRDRLAE